MEAAFPMLVGLLQPTYFQFIITICEIAPPIWRRIRVPNYLRFYALHSAIQDAFGWTSNYAYQFEDFSTKPPGDAAYYSYNFVKRWKFHIVLENMTQLEVRVTYPVCLAGRHGGPPERIGSVEAFQTQWAIAADPNHPQREDSRRLLTAMGFLEQFDLLSVSFKNHIERFQLTNGK